MNTILFDLDGTLLPLDAAIFEKEYFKGVSSKLSSYFPPEESIKYIWQATVEMVKNMDSSKTNKDIFIEKFAEITQRDPEKMYTLFLDFYRNEYKVLKDLIIPSEFIVNSINTLKEKGYRLIIATNPLFPLEAILDRVNWAGLNHKDFELITCFEEMHFCKPQINYYEEVLEKIDEIPENCLMVGNDVEEDLVARKLGIKTFLIEDNILNRKNIDYSTDYKGSYQDFFNFVQSLPDKKI